MNMKVLLISLLASTFSFAQKIEHKEIDPKPAIRELVYPFDSDKFFEDKLPLIASDLAYKGRSACTNDELPLGIYFSDYTIDESGQIVYDGGWSQVERDVYFGFICKMMPILMELYGPPFERYNLLFVKDLRFTTSAMFVPTDRTIRTGGRYWAPQLITHELLHAFRGTWHLTKANNSSQYSPQLSGFEEGFAQGVSYDAMNAYLDFYGVDEYVTRNVVWLPETEWDYDFKNDLSMITEDFWSEEAGTRKFYERYEQSAAAIQKLNVKIPQFYLRFNQLYYQTIRNTPNYQPTRQSIVQIIDQLTDDTDILDYINKQNILQCRTLFGKKVYTTTNYAAYQFAYHRIHFVETFPNKNEWYHYVPSEANYLYHRLNYNLGYLNVFRAWNNSLLRMNEIVNMKDLRGWGAYEACGINCAKGFAAEDLMFYSGSTPPATGFNNPLLIPQPTTAGLYRLQINYTNPHYSMTPAFGISYDRFQSHITDNRYEMLGISTDGWNNNRIFGGVVNLDKGAGFVKITHSLYPNSSLVVPIANSLFMTAGLNDWYQIVRGVQTTKPGTLTFEIQSSSGKVISREKRYIIYGNNNAKHKFLFELIPQPLKAKAIGPQ